MSPLLVFLFVVSVSASNLDECTTSCAGSLKKDACMQGCYYAYALTLAPETPGDRPTCKKACKDNLIGDEETACQTGCDQFENGGAWSGALGLMNIARTFMSQLFSGKPEDPASAATNSDSGPITVSRIRIFIPIDQPDLDSAGVIPQELAQPADEPGSQPVKEPHHVMFMHRASADSKSVSVGEDMECWLRRMIRAPFVLLFVVTLSTLVILLFVQLAVCLRRRHSTPRGYRYSPLPTYAEATNVKVPISDEEDADLKQPLKQQETEA